MYLSINMKKLKYSIYRLFFYYRHLPVPIWTLEQYVYLPISIF